MPAACLRPAIAICAAAWKARASSRSPTNGCGAGTACAVRQDVPAGLQSASVALSTPIRSGPPPIRRLADLSLRQGQPQLFRYPLALLLGLLDRRRAKPDPGHPSSARLHYTFDHPVLGGELGYNFNFTSLTRTRPSLMRSTRPPSTPAPARRPPTPRSIPPPIACCAPYPAPTAGSRRKPLAAQLHRQVRPGVYPVRLAARRRRSMQINNEPGVSNYIETGDTSLVRAMPTIGLEYRYPFISVNPGAPRPSRRSPR